MTLEQLQQIEDNLKARGYRRYNVCLTSNEDWTWFRSFCRTEDEDGDMRGGYQIGFRVWDWRKYPQNVGEPLGMDVWMSPCDTHGRMDLTVSFDPAKEIEYYERLAAEFFELSKKYLTE